MTRYWPIAFGLPLLAGLAYFGLRREEPPAPAKKPEPPSRVIEGVTVKRPEPRVVTMPETPKEVDVARARVRDLVNQAVAAGVRGDKTTRGALVQALKKEPNVKSEIDAMLASTGGTEAAHLAALVKEVAP